MAKKIRVAIVGGQWGTVAHLPAFRALPDYEVVAICTAHRESAERLAKQHNIPMAFWDWREVVKHPEIDVVDAVLRPRIRTEVLLEAIRNGKHVSGDVPHTANSADAKLMWDEIRRTGVKSYLGYEWQLMPAFRVMSEKVKEGFIGEPYFGHGQLLFAMYGTPEHSLDYLWQGDAREGANALHNLAGSALSIMRQCFNSEVREVSGIGDTMRKVWHFPDGKTMTPDAIDTGVMLVQFDNGFTASVQGSWVPGASNFWLMDLYGSEGRLQVETPPNDGVNCNLNLIGAKRGEGASVPIPTTFSDAFFKNCTLDPETTMPKVACAYAEGFIRLAEAIKTGGEAYPNFEDGYRLIKVCDAAIESHKTKKWITMDY